MIESNNKLLKIVDIYFLSSIGIEEILENGQNVSLTIYSGFAWEQIKFTEAAYSEPASETDNGTRYNQQLAIVLAGDDATTQARLVELQTNKPIFRFDYHDGTSKIIGDKENYCKILHSQSSEEFVTKNDITVYRSSAYKAFFLT